MLIKKGEIYLANLGNIKKEDIACIPETPNDLQQ